MIEEKNRKKANVNSVCRRRDGVVLMYFYDVFIANTAKTIASSFFVRRK